MNKAAHLVYDHHDSAKVKVTRWDEAPGAAEAEVMLVENVGTKDEPVFCVCGTETRPPLSLQGPGRVNAEQIERDHSILTLYTLHPRPLHGRDTGSSGCF